MPHTARDTQKTVSSYFFITTPAVAAASVPVTSRVNNDLIPEIGNQFEVGTKGALQNGKLTYELALFNAVFSNKMTTVAVPLNATTTMYSYVVNGGKQKHKGIEALVKYTAYQSASGFFKAVTPFANFTYSDFKYDNFKFQTVGKTAANKDTALTSDFSGQQVAGVAKTMFNVGIDVFTNPGFYFNINLLNRGGMPITSDGVYKTKSYTLLNSKLGYQKALSKHFDADFYFGINNITGTQYPFMVFANQLPDAYLPAPLKANYFGGINLKYNF